MLKSLFKLCSAVTLLLVFSSMATAQSQGDTFAAAKASKSAKWVLTYSEAPGFASKNASGQMTGICVDIMTKFQEYVQEKHGIKVSMSYNAKNPNDFTKFLDEVKNSKGGVFGLSNTTITTARKSIYNFSPAYITNIGMILTNSNVPTMTQLSDISSKFAGMTAVTIKNSTNEKRILDIKKQYFPSMKIEYVPSFAKAMDAIAADSKKFTNVDFTYYFEAIQNRKSVKRHPGGDDKTEEFGIIMPKSNDWSPILAEFMNGGFLESVEYKKIISNNLGQSAMKFFDTLK
ncbi:substrate-binding periplasmic protein [Fulvivirga lutimaris]|uniref:substrate-binding periplasmic protein n=1 Tax=Fulvivirga lutimaris TaxID=1819566 RepID=UPI0012BC226A|nr:transporter substrate-binding domain-containing protein [Fulvivirga lutimaris]MTI39623.1 transporter substrate-binding domain-containing protein [Fulvivirga lutimaris]